MKKILKYLLYAVLINFIITNTVDGFIHPDMTRTRLFLRTPHSFLWNFR
jgi:hypothetical protein